MAVQPQPQPSKNAVVFIDTSGSTSWVESYWVTVDRVIRGRHDASFFTWNHQYSRISYAEAINLVTTKRGSGGTEISTIYEACKKEIDGEKENIDDLVIITDGQVEPRSVHEVWRLLQEDRNKKKWKHVEAHLVTSYPNTSVIAPFIDGCTFDVFDDKTELVAGSHIGTDDDLQFVIDSLQTAADFKARHDDLNARIGANSIFRNTCASVRESLIQLQKRLILAAQLQSITNLTNLQKEDVVPTQEQVLQDANNFYDFQSSRLDEENPQVMISRLIEKCAITGNLSLDQLRMNRDARHAIPAPAPMLEEIDVSLVPSDNKYFDEITCEPGFPALVATENRCILPLLPKDHYLYDAIKRNPLLFFLDSKLVEEFVRRLNVKPVGFGTLAGLKRAKQCNSHYFSIDEDYESEAEEEEENDHHMEREREVEITHPETREKVIAVAVLGSHKTHVVANKAFIARVIFGSDTMSGSYALWMSVLWTCLHKTQPYVLDNGVGEIADRFMKSLMLNTPVDQRVWLGLDGTGSRPTQKVSLGSALLYAGISSNAWINFPERDVMRELWGVWPVIKNLLTHAEIPIPDGTEERIDDVARASRLLKDVKATSVDHQLRLIYEAYVKTITVKQHSFCDERNVFLLDAKNREPTEKEKLVAYWLSQRIVSPDFRIGAVRLPSTANRSKPLPDPIPDLGRKYGESENVEFDLHLDEGIVNPLTLRPYVTDDDGKLLEYIHHVETYNKTGLSMYRRMIQFYIEYGRFPDEDSASGSGDKAAFFRLLVRVDGKRFGGVLPRGIDSMYRCVLRSIHYALEERAKLGISMKDSVIRADIMRGNPRSERVVMEKEYRAMSL